MRFIVEYESLAKAEEVRPDVETLADAPEFTIHGEIFPFSTIVVDRSESHKRLQELEKLPGVKQIWLEDVLIPQIATVDPETWRWGLRTALEIFDEAMIEKWSERELMEAGSRVLASGLWAMGDINYKAEVIEGVTPFGPIKSPEDIAKYIEADKCPNRGEDSIIVIFDTGVAKNAVKPEHRYAGYVPLEEKIERYWAFTPKRGCHKLTADPWRDWYGHATMVTSIAYGAVDSGIEGIAPNANIVSVKVIGLFSEFMKGFEWVMRFAEKEDKHVVVNMSWGIGDWRAPISPNHPFLKAYAAFCLHPNVTVVNAAGNSGYVQQPTPFGAEMNTIGSMESMPWNICVGACGEDGYPQNMQNYSSRGGGRWGGKPDVTAPTHGVVAWCDQTGYSSQKVWIGNRGGTSAATPVVTGTAAIVASDLKEKGLLGENTTEMIKRKIITAADQLPFWNIPGTWSPRHGAGIVKALGAVYMPPIGAVNSDHLTTFGTIGGLAAGGLIAAKVFGFL